MAGGTDAAHGCIPPLHAVLTRPAQGLALGRPVHELPLGTPVQIAT